MPVTSAETTPHPIHAVMPPILIGADLLDSVQAAMPRPPADAPLAWQDPGRAQIIAAIAAYRPSDALQALLAAQIVTCRVAADDMRWRSSAPNLPVQVASCWRRTGGRLMRTAELMAHTLRRLQAEVVRHAGA